MAMFTIDGESFEVDIIDLERGAEVIDKYAKRVENGEMKRKILGVYFNYYITLPNFNSNSAAYARLYDKVTEPVEFHNIVVPGTIGTYSYKAYITAGKDKLMEWREDGKHVWGGLKISFIAQSPARK